MQIDQTHCIVVGMGPKPYVPKSLRRGPFTLEKARREGLDKWHLEGSSWRRIGPATYIWAGLAETPIQRLRAAALRLPGTAAFSGLTAAWLHGLDVAPCDPIEVTIPKHVGISARSGLKVRRASLDRVDISSLQGMRVTSFARTLAEVCSRLTLTEGVVIADMALHSGRVSVAELNSWAERHPRRAGTARFRRVISHAEPETESPMESRLRMLLVLRGLPRPKAQVSLHDRWGRFVGRPDLYYEAHRLGIEYDGGVHRDSMANDNRRQNRLLNAGIRLLRFTASDVLNNQDLVAALVRAQITASAGTDGSRVA